jgi:hypothetical protein
LFARCNLKGIGPTGIGSTSSLDKGYLMKRFIWAKSYIATVAVIAVVLAALAAPSAGLGAEPPKCVGSQLTLTFVSFQGATGGRFWEMAFKNKSTTCTLRGFPTVKLLEKHRHAIHKSVGHWTVAPVKTVTLARNKLAFFVFRYTDGGFCPGRGFDAARFEFIPPNGHADFVYNPVSKNHGVPSLCTASSRVTAVSAKQI